MYKHYDLPAPSALQIERSLRLSTFIRQQIAEQEGAMSFSRFMEFALFHPDLGYYNSEEFTIGAGGDFTTAPEISPLFAASFVNPILQIMQQLGGGAILEIGAGTGRFAHDLLLSLAKIERGPIHYFIYEKSKKLRNAQQTLLSAALLERAHIEWLDELPHDFKGIIIANEVLDVLPVHCFHFEHNTILERCVSYKDEAFTWEKRLPTTEILTEKAQSLVENYHLPDGYASEISLSLPEVIERLAKCLNAGALLFIDYGYGRQEYYRKERHTGTLTCFYQHRKHHDPLILAGLQDITAHVDFTTVVESAVEHECTLAGFTSQAAFLLECGITDLVNNAAKDCSMLAEQQLMQEFKVLTAPNEMGEIIKVMGLTKQMHSIKGFSLNDRRRDL